MGIFINSCSFSGYMVTTYDVFYVTAERGPLKIIEIVKRLGKDKSEHQNIRKLVLELEEEGFVKYDKTVSVILNEKTKQLYKIIVFCIKNSMNHNLLFRGTMLDFLEKAAKKEFFSIEDVSISPDTFTFYTKTLERYGLLLIVSRKPIKAKLLELQFFMNLFSFFKRKIKFYKQKVKSLLPEIQKEFKKFKKTIDEGIFILTQLEKKEEINFIHMSLSLEGNPITLSDTKKLIMENVVPTKYKLETIQEVTNYKKAVDLMIENASKKVKLNLQLILYYHKLAMYHIHGAGEIRKQNVYIKGNPDFKTCDWHLLHKKLNEVMKKYEAFEAKKKDVGEIIDFAAFFHNEFQRIHPFIDGNSRISRLLMFHILRGNSLPVLDFPLGFFDLYMDLTKRSRKRDDEMFAHIIQEMILFNLKKVNNLK